MKKILNSNSLKLIAIFTMLLDHIGVLYSDVSVVYFPLRFIGRICAPIMFYSLAKGYLYTKNKLNYAIRLLIFALISQVPYSLFSSGKFFNYLNYNVIFTLFLGLMCLLILDKVNNRLIKYSLIVLCCILSCFCDYAVIGILYVLAFYGFRESRYKYVIYSILVLLSAGINLFVYRNMIHFIITLGALFVIPLICLDNGNKGKYNLKYLFYVFYPLHMLVLYFFI